MAGPPPRPPRPPAAGPAETTFSQSALSLLEYEVTLAVRSASILVWGVPAFEVVNPGSSNITHEPASMSVRLMDTGDAWLSALISVPLWTLVAPVTVKLLPLRLRT